MWQLNPGVATGAQVFVFVGLVVVGMMIVLYYVRTMPGRDK
jgi:hypothetical protein